MSMPPLPSFDLKRNYVLVKDEIRAAVDRVLDSQNFILGSEVSSFEEEAARYLAIPWAVGCASGTDALVLALMSAGIGPGDEVITTPFSFFATASCVVRCGATPVFVDVEPDTYNISMDAVVRAITPRTKAVIPVHLFGQLCPLEEITPLLREKNILIIEDCAQAFGAHRTTSKGIVRAGGAGDYGCFSFFPTKNLGAYGDAGMVTCFDEGIRDELASLRVHGAKVTYMHEKVGINSRLDAIQAAILRVRLRHIEEWTENRREAARRYELLCAERGLGEWVTVPVEAERNRHTYHQYVIRASYRDELEKHLTERGITVRVYYPLALHMQPCFAREGHGPGSCPIAEKLTGEVLALPMFPEITADEQERVAEAIAEFYQGGRSAG